MTNTKPIRRVAIIGTGVIGASWAAQYLAKGLEVVATDIAPDAETALRKFVKSAWPALERLGLSPGASQAKLKFTADLAKAVVGVDTGLTHFAAVSRSMAMFAIFPSKPCCMNL